MLTEPSDAAGALVDPRGNAEAERDDVVVEQLADRRVERRRAAPPRSRAASASRGGAATRPSRSTRPARIFVPPRSTPITRVRSCAADNLTRRMPGQEKPYRVYRGGTPERKGAAPGATGRATRGARQARGRHVVPRAGPGQAAEALVAGPADRPRDRAAPRCVHRRLGASPATSPLRSGVETREQATAGADRGGADPSGLAASCSSPTNILLLGTDHSNWPGHERQRSDSIMLDPHRPVAHRIAYLSIPRDLRVPDPRRRRHEDQRRDAGGRAAARDQDDLRRTPDCRSTTSSSSTSPQFET